MSHSTSVRALRQTVLAFQVLALTACGSTSPGATQPPAAGHAPAQWVAGIVIDQLGSSTLQRYLPYLADDGLIKRAIARGTYIERVRYAYATTVTAVGHAAIYTGQPPRYSGITSNRVWHPKLGKWLNVVDDQKHQVFSASTEFASPAALTAQTIGDKLKAATQNRARVVSVSIKPWPAVMSGGTKADMVAWYSDTSPGRMVTSTYYAKQLPAWMTRWNDQHPVDTYLGVWSPANPQLLQQRLGNDSRTGEGHVHGWDSAMPHDPKMSTNPHAAFTLTPQSSVYLLDFARAAHVHYDMGQDNAPDLLMISISASDKIGHVFGPDSWEYLDHLFRLDRFLGAFVSELEAQSRVAVLVTSDHGVGPLPEQSSSKAAGRLSPVELTQRLQKAAARRMGPGNWIAPVDQPFVAFGASVKTASQRQALVALTKNVLDQDKRIAAVYDLQALKARPEPESEPEALVWRSTPTTITADLFIVPAQGVILCETGTTHGSPWAYDREVPALVYGAGVPLKHVPNTVSQSRVAATFAELLGMPTPQSGVDSLLQ